MVWVRSSFRRTLLATFVSYYDYYQPEAYMPVSDTYIEKDLSINEELDKLRFTGHYANCWADEGTLL